MVNTKAPKKPPPMNHGLMIARSMDWNAPTKVRSSVFARPGRVVLPKPAGVQTSTSLLPIPSAKCFLGVHAA
jgi:hypothetical protein